MFLLCINKHFNLSFSMFKFTVKLINVVFDKNGNNSICYFHFISNNMFSYLTICKAFINLIVNLNIENNKS